MKYWLLVADASTYGFDELERDGTAVWDGIRGSLAQKHLREMRRGDQAVIYHTAPAKAAVGTARVTSDAYPDPKDREAKLVVADLEPARRFDHAVALAALRENEKLAGMTFLKIQRIAVSPLEKKEYDEIVRMGSPRK